VWQRRKDFKKLSAACNKKLNSQSDTWRMYTCTVLTIGFPTVHTAVLRDQPNPQGTILSEQAATVTVQVI